MNFPDFFHSDHKKEILRNIQKFDETTKVPIINWIWEEKKLEETLKIVINLIKALKKSSKEISPETIESRPVMQNLRLLELQINFLIKFPRNDEAQVEKARKEDYSKRLEENIAKTKIILYTIRNILHADSIDYKPKQLTLKNKFDDNNICIPGCFVCCLTDEGGVAVFKTEIAELLRLGYQIESKEYNPTDTRSRQEIAGFLKSKTIKENLKEIEHISDIPLNSNMCIELNELDSHQLKSMAEYAYDIASKANYPGRRINLDEHPTKFYGKFCKRYNQKRPMQCQKKVCNYSMNFARILIRQRDINRLLLKFKTESIPDNIKQNLKAIDIIHGDVLKEIFSESSLMKRFMIIDQYSYILSLVERDGNTY